MRVPIARQARVSLFTSAGALAILLLALPAAASASPRPHPVSLAVSPTSDYLPQGVTRQLHAIATYSDASTADVTLSTRWSSSDDVVASVAARAVVTHAMGTAMITAKWKNFAGTATVTVADTLTQIVVSPSFVFAYVGDTVSFTAVGRPATGLDVDVMPFVEWSSSDPQSAPIGASGAVTCLDLAFPTIVARLGSVSGGASMTCGLPG